MSGESKTSTPHLAREHARAQGNTRIQAMPTIPATLACNLPVGINAGDVMWDETIAAGEYCSRVLKRGTRLRLNNLEGDGCVSLIAFNADQLTERLNVADTIKVQWNAYLKPGALLLSDMGRALFSITQDTSGHHDGLCGASCRASNARKYGEGDNYTQHPNARDRFLLAVLKHGLGRRDIPPCINFFKSVRVADDGAIRFEDHPRKSGEFVELRADMNVLVVAVNMPHVLDPLDGYVCTPVRVLAYGGEVASPDDPIRHTTPESIRAFENTDDYFAR